MMDLASGRLEVISSERSVVVTTAIQGIGISEITIDGQANLDMTGEGFNLSVLEGEVIFDGERIETGNILAFDAIGQRDTRPVIAMTSFGTSARMLVQEYQEIPVFFSWNASNFTADTSVIVEIATDRNFNNIVASQTSYTKSNIPIRKPGNISCICCSNCYSGKRSRICRNRRKFHFPFMDSHTRRIILPFRNF
jgi:hypothetical protein